ncbi:hypothetical protein J2I47_07955 [Fibrella sp. HMF5335]|uniref:Uncharacterized protein n=1 Tax=Fibrella rubiginis TaxID=2817060 RepID=A0A939K499_9BACT|nr:hypothetical protein [Fibrella rubiginis]MBO0936473.1 hypothetical protein [Fibrella rubiginis]
MTTTEASLLPTLLGQMIDELAGSQWYYWLHANYFDIQPPTKRTQTRWWQAPLFFDDDALRNPVIAVDALLIDVILINKLPAEWERIRIDYSQIYSLKRFNRHQQRMQTDEYLLYYDAAKLQMPPLDKA